MNTGTEAIDFDELAINKEKTAMINKFNDKKEYLWAIGTGFFIFTPCLIVLSNTREKETAQAVETNVGEDIRPIITVRNRESIMRCI